MLNHYRKKYNVGTRVRLTHMNDPYTKIKLGEAGTVVGVDDIGTIHVTWDCGYKLGIAYGEDSCEVIEE